MVCGFSKTTVLQVEPSFIGQTVLDISKLIMYKFRYENLIRYAEKYRATFTLSAGDTDSFFIHLKGMSSEKFLIV